MTDLAWGILGTGNIARTFATQLATANAGQCLAVASRTPEKAGAFGDKFDIPRRYENYEALLDDSDVDVVYVSTPHPFHAEWAIRALEAGKHILCEKPMTLNFAQAEAVVEAARASDRFLMEAFMYRCHPQTARLVELLSSGVIGEIGVIQATHSYRTNFVQRSRIFSPELGGGGILDVGGYPISMVRRLAGVAVGEPFVDPIDFAGYGRIGKSGVDEYAVGVLKFPRDVVAQVSSGVRASQGGPMVRISGSEGEIHVPAPWTCGDRNAGPYTSKLTVRGRDGSSEELIESQVGRYAHEANHVADCIAEGLRQSPLMSWDDTLGNMATLDRWRDGLGLRYPHESPKRVTTVTRLPLARQGAAHMTYGRIAGVEIPISQLVLGRGVAVDMRDSGPTMDSFFEQGGNCFDTAFIYDKGEREKTVGQWLTNRELRREAVIIGKGAHTPNCNPEALDRELKISLDRLQTDYIDIYMLHRDNAGIPVGEFIDALNRHVDAGRVHAIGVSNWSIERISQANVWAEANGMRGFVAVSNQYSLARPLVKQIWAGCVDVGDPESLFWFERTQTALIPWSSQSQGFFVRGHPAERSERQMVRCWYGDDNFERLRRARELAAERGFEAVHVALAWVLTQPFPTFPVIGPRNLRELNSSMRGLDLELTPEELRWLDLADAATDRSVVQ